jgi:membrane-bound metal-dependent hydrolase YbcI (DUF457 family)
VGGAVTYRGHLAVGGTLAVGVWKCTAPTVLAIGPFTRILLIAVVLVGALAPDLDIPQSYLSRHLLGPLRWGVVLLKWCISNPLTWALFGFAPTRRPDWSVDGAGSAWWWIVFPFRWMANGRQRVVWIVRHRGFSHSFLGVGLATLTLGAAVWFGAAAATRTSPGAFFLGTCCGVDRVRPITVFAVLIASAFGLGCLSHLFADALTISGVPLFLPWSSRRVAIGPRELRLRSH